MVRYAFKFSIFGIAYAGYQYITGMAAEKKKKAAKKQKALTDQRAVEKFQEDMLKKFEGKDLLGENLADLENMQMTADTFLASQGMPLATTESKSTTSAQFKIYDAQDNFVREQKRQRRKQEMHTLSNRNLAMLSMMDSPQR